MTNPEQLLVQPYLFFDGCCEAALNFYQQSLGAEITWLMRHKENPESTMVAPEFGEKILYASFRIGESTIMASDHCKGKPNFDGFSLSISAKDISEADRLFNALAQEGKVQMPQTKTFFSSRFGMVTDRFGVLWMIIVHE